MTWMNLFCFHFQNKKKEKRKEKKKETNKQTDKIPFKFICHVNISLFEKFEQIDNERLFSFFRFFFFLRWIKNNSHNDNSMDFFFFFSLNALKFVTVTILLMIFGGVFKKIYLYTTNIVNNVSRVVKVWELFLSF